MGFSDRAVPMRAAALRLRERRDELARLMAMEMGKPFAQGQAEADKCAWVCEYFAEHAESFLRPESAETDALRSYVAHRPLGVILAVMPWNFPLWQVFRCVAPGLMAGNAIVLKHASNVSGCALAIEEILGEAGFPGGLFRTLLVESRGVAPIIEDPRIRAVTLTGSVPAGSAVAAKAGEMLKKTVLELGGSDAYVVLEDADLEAAVAACVKSRLINSGQSCIAAKRFIVVESVRREFEERLVARVAAEIVGDPMAEGTTVGPLAREDLRAELHGQVRRTVGAGARLLVGGEMPGGDGWFYPPTVLSEVRPGMAAFDEETFGPVAAIVGARDEREAIELANASDFGLGAAVFTRDRVRGERIAVEELEAGSCFVNDFVKSDPRLPFGGVKRSGYGRELGMLGIREFVNAKTVCVR
jgi:succinate-semialdehyde dehydrogenase/glutarate-semialdehyde dehydrogenase